LWKIIPLRGCIREIADFLAINIIVEPRSATYLERYVTTGKCLILSTDEALDANEAVNSYQERDDHREVVSHPEDVGGTSLAKQVFNVLYFFNSRLSTHIVLSKPPSNEFLALHISTRYYL